MANFSKASSNGASKQQDRVYLCFDLGGTALKVGVITFSASGEFSVEEIHNESHHMFANGPISTEDLQKLLTDHYNRLTLDGQRFDGIGVATFGSVNPTTKRIQNYMDGTPTYKDWSWSDAFLDVGFEGPVDVLNDGQAAALGVCREDGAPGTNVALVMGTGLGAGAAEVRGNQTTLIRGGTGNAGLFGNLLVSASFEGKLIANVRAGELLATGGIRKHYSPDSDSPEEALKQLVNDLGNSDERALAFYNDVLVQGTAVLLTNLHQGFDPQNVVFAGGITKALPDLASDALLAAMPLIGDQAKVVKNGSAYTTCIGQIVTVSVSNEINPNLLGMATAVHSMKLASTSRDSGVLAANAPRQTSSRTKQGLIPS